MPGRARQPHFFDDVSPDHTAPSPDSHEQRERRRAARAVAVAALDLGDLRELLAMLGLDDLPQARPTPRLPPHDDSPPPDEQP